MQTKTVLVTVGTTKFDELIKTVTSDEVLEALNQKGYNRLVLQIGKTDIQPDCTTRCGFYDIESFNLTPSLHEHMKSADLIISHAGAGSCLEALELSKPLVVVINDCLMDNHQTELAEQLYKDGHLLYSNCKNLFDLIRSMDISELKPFKQDRSMAIAIVIDKIMGFG